MSVDASVRAADFLRWWGQSLAAWLPAGWRRGLGMVGARLLLQPAAGELRLLHGRPDGERELARLPLPLPADGGDPLARVLRANALRLPRWMLLPHGSALRRMLPLPAAAAPRLREVLGFEIERQTPFAADAVAYDARIVSVQPDGNLLAELVVVPRTTVEAARVALQPAAHGLAGIDLQDAHGHPLGVNLIPAGERLPERHPQRLRNLLLAAIALLLAGLAMAQVLANRRAAADALEAQVRARAMQARTVSAQRQALVDGVEGAQWLQQQRASRPPTVEVLDALARALPDGTYVDKVAIEGGRLTVIGLSSQAASLVGRMQGDRQPWRNPALSGALQPDPATRLDRFTLIAELPTAAAPAAGRKGGRSDAP